MITVNTSNTRLDSLGNLNLVMQFISAEPEEPNEQNEFGPHTHQSYEIFFNLSGEVSFMVEDKIYPVKRGTLVFTRPNDYHHVIFRNNSVHKYICIWVSGVEREDVLFESASGAVNLLGADIEKFEHICKSFTKNQPLLDKYIMFLELMKIIRNNRDKGQPVLQDSTFPADISMAIEYIYEHLSQNIKINDIAKNCGVSVNTLERHFLKILNIKPIDFLKEKRLTLSSELLMKGMSVQQVSDFAGFSSHSSFISMFKQKYGTTPLQYKKRARGKIN